MASKIYRWKVLNHDTSAKRDSQQYLNALVKRDASPLESTHVALLQATTLKSKMKKKGRIIENEDAAIGSLDVEGNHDTGIAIGVNDHLNKDVNCQSCGN